MSSHLTALMRKTKLFSNKITNSEVSNGEKFMLILQIVKICNGNSTTLGFLAKGVPRLVMKCCHLCQQRRIVTEKFI